MEEKKSKLTDNQIKELRILLDRKDYWTTREVLELLKEKYGVEYSQKQIGVILHSFHMYHPKPYTLDYRRPENAEEILKKVNRSNSSIYWSSGPIYAGIVSINFF